MKLKITVHGVPYEVDVEVLDAGDDFAMGPLPMVHQTQAGAPVPSMAPAPMAAAPAPRRKKKPVGTAASSDGGNVTSPVAGNVVEVKCKVGESVKEGDILLVIEAMKMNTSIAAPVDGTVKATPVAKGDAIVEGQTLVEFE